MNETLRFLAQHGYWLLIGAVLGRQACLPIPANLLLVSAGAQAHTGRMRLLAVIGLSVMTFVLADLAWYEAGRRWGDRVLQLLCGLSGDPAACVERAASAFARHGLRILLISKFLVGVDVVATPLAGAARKPLARFIVCDALGAMFWSVAYAALGYIFSDQLDRVALHVARMGAVLVLAVGAGFGFYLGRKFVRWQRFLRQFKLARISPQELRDKLRDGEDILIVDLQGRLQSSTNQLAIPGAVRINPRKLEEYRDIEIPRSRKVVLYCGCPGESTSARVALALRKKGIDRVRPLAGGLQAWLDLGFPVTTEALIPPSAAVLG